MTYTTATNLNAALAARRAELKSLILSRAPVEPDRCAVFESVVDRYLDAEMPGYDEHGMRKAKGKLVVSPSEVWAVDCLRDAFAPNWYAASTELAPLKTGGIAVEIDWRRPGQYGAPTQ